MVGRPLAGRPPVAQVRVEPGQVTVIPVDGQVRVALPTVRPSRRVLERPPLFY